MADRAAVKLPRRNDIAPAPSAHGKASNAPHAGRCGNAHRAAFKIGDTGSSAPVRFRGVPRRR